MRILIPRGRRARSSLSLVAAAFLAGCSGSIGDGGGETKGSTTAPGNGGPGAVGPGPSGPAGPGPAGPGPTGRGSSTPPQSGGPAPTCSTVDPGPSPLRRLTRVEYDNTVRTLLGRTDAIAAELLPRDEEQFGFDNSAEGRGLNSALAEGYLRATERLAKDAVAKLPSLLPCDSASKGDGPCLDAFLDGFAQRAWRRPLEDAEKQNLRMVFANGKGPGGTFAQGIDAVIQVLLMSPQFLYRDERGVEEAGKPWMRLTSWELASRLSFLLWGGMPDDELFAAARDGKLTSREQIADQARRMLKDERAFGMMKNFYGQWLQLGQLDSLDKEAMDFPTWKESTAKLMRQETESLVDHIVRNDGKLETLFTAPYTFMNAELAAFYGQSGVTGTEFKKVDVDATQRAGIVTQGGFLSSHATPSPGLTALIFRGVFVREHFLCQPLPEPPADAAEMSPPVTPTTTPRSWSKDRMAITACAGCHALIDPVGYGFEGFNEIGLPRGKATDTTGEIAGSDVAGPYNGPVELAKKLAGSKDARACVATQWFRFAHGRLEDEKRDGCSLTQVRQAFDKSGGDLRELMVALTQTDAFLLRSKGDAP